MTPGQAMSRAPAPVANAGHLSALASLQPRARHNALLSSLRLRHGGEGLREARGAHKADDAPLPRTGACGGTTPRRAQQARARRQRGALAEAPVALLYDSPLASLALL